MSIEEREFMNKLTESYTYLFGGKSQISKYQTRVVFYKREDAIKMLQFFWKNHRKLYYKLNGRIKENWYGKRVEGHAINDKVFEDWGSGYLPNFSDEPDYYYIYY